MWLIWQLKFPHKIFTVRLLRLTTGNKKHIKITFFLILISFFAANLCFWLLPGVFETWNAQTVDQLFVLRSNWNRFRPCYNNKIVHIDLTNTSIKRLENQYFNRSHFAKVIGNLSKMNVSAQVYDFIIAARKNALNDKALIKAVNDSANVYFGLAFKLSKQREAKKQQHGYSKDILYLDQTKWQVVVESTSESFYNGSNPLLTFYELARTSKGLGSLSIKFDPDGVLRRAPLLVRYNDAYYPILPFKVICDYLHVPPDKIIVKPGKHIILKNAKKPGDLAAHDIVIPIDQHGNMIVNFIGPWERMDHYDFADIMMAADNRGELEMWKKELGDKIVIVSDVSTGTTDIGPVPTDHSFPFSGVHSNIIHNIMTESFLKDFSKKQMFAVEIILMILVLVLSIRFSSFYFSLGTLLLASFYVMGVMASFLYLHLILNLIRPLIMVALAAVSIVVYRYINEEKEKIEGLRQRDFIRQIFSRYLSNEVVEELLGSSEALKMSGEMSEVTFLVSDLRGFTALSSELPPNDVIQLLNSYLEKMVEIINRYRGTLNEFTGDGVLVFFGAPLTHEDDPQRAIACAIEMQNALLELNVIHRNNNLPEFSMGIGINSGEVVVGNIGSEKRAKYTAIGSPINITFRIESYTTGGQILISPDTFEKVRTLVRTRGSLRASFKGIDHPLNLYDIVSIEGKYQNSLKEKTPDELTRLQSPVPINCFLIEEKTVSEKVIEGHIIRLGVFSAEVLLEKPIESHVNLKLLLASPETEGCSGLYSKVVSVYPKADSKNNRVYLEFTWIPKNVKRFLFS
jgi:adenylate cyclase